MQNSNGFTPTPEAIEALVDQTFETGKEAVAALNNKPDEYCDQWPVRNLSHAYAERPPWQYLVEGLIPYPSLIAVYGGPGSLKSMLLADMCAAIAGGTEWLPPLQGDLAMPGVTFTVEQGPIFWIDFDNGTRRTDERMDAVASARQLPVDTPFHYVSMPRPWLDLNRVELVTSLSKRIKGLGAKLVVIDNLGLVTGDTEENSGDMAQLMGQLRWLCEDTESCIAVIHHQRKSSGALGKDIPKGETLRGHSSINAALDLAMLVERSGGGEDITCMLTKVRGYSEYLMFGGKFTFEHTEGTHDLDSAKFYSRAVNDAEELKNMAIVSEILRTIEKSPGITQQELVGDVQASLEANQKIKAGRNIIRGIIKNMEEEGDITAVRDSKRNNAINYHI